MNMWSHLPNAVHIDRVIASVNQHPEIWSAAHDAARDAVRHAARHAVRHAARHEAWCAAHNAAWSAAHNAAHNAARDVAWCAAWSAVRHAARHAASSAILSLIAYDDCEQYLSMTSEELRLWSLLSNNPAAILLLPVVIAFERIKKLETV